MTPKAYFPAVSFVITFLLTAASLAAVALFWSNSLMLTGIIIAVSLAMFAIKYETKEVIFYLVMAIWGASAESIEIFFGAWSYSAPDFIGIPFWLPFGWGIAAIFMTRAWEELKTFISFRRASISRA